MSCCTFLLIKGGKVKLMTTHYSGVGELMADKEAFERARSYDIRDSDTANFPAYILDYDKKQIASTQFNWFMYLDDKDVLPIMKKYGWVEVGDFICKKCKHYRVRIKGDLCSGCKKK